jgi:hypothetical protein
MVESPPDLMMLEAKATELSIQLEDKLAKIIQMFSSDHSKVTHIRNNLDSK